VLPANIRDGARTEHADRTESRQRQGIAIDNERSGSEHQFDSSPITPLATEPRWQRLQIDRVIHIDPRVVGRRNIFLQMCSHRCVDIARSQGPSSQALAAVVEEVSTTLDRARPEPCVVFSPHQSRDPLSRRYRYAENNESICRCPYITPPSWRFIGHPHLTPNDIGVLKRPPAVQSTSALANEVLKGLATLSKR